MKKSIAMIVVGVLVLGIIVPINECYAGDEGWAAAGGLVGGLILGSAMSSRPRYYYNSPYYYDSYPTVYSYPVYSTYGYRPYRYYYPRGCGGYTSYYDDYRCY